MDLIVRGTPSKMILEYTFLGTEASGTEIITGPNLGPNVHYLGIRKIAEAGIASTTGDVGYFMLNGVSNETFFASDAALNAGSAMVVDQVAGANPLVVNGIHRLTVKTSSAAVVGNAGLRLRLVVDYINVSG